MLDDAGVDALVQQWTAERTHDAETVEIHRIASEWLAEAPISAPGIPGQRQRGGAGRFAAVDADPRYVAAMRKRLPDVPVDLLAAAASCWQLVGGVAEAEEWWDAGLSPLTVLEHLRRGSAPAWCVARLNRQK